MAFEKCMDPKRVHTFFRGWLVQQYMQLLNQPTFKPINILKLGIVAEITEQEASLAEDRTYNVKV